MKLKIITASNPILRQKSKPIVKIDRQIKKLSQRMIFLIKEGRQGKPVGVGLSAVQVGKLLRLLVVFNPKKKQYRVLINPEIIKKSKTFTEGVPESKNKFEGCLSIPGIYGVVQRVKWLQLYYQDLQGERKKEKFTGFAATVIQHEYDHLEGILFVDRIFEQGGKIYQLEKTAEGEELKEIDFPYLFPVR
ncbi:MAG TPA: peptide deformylase [Candidatus Bathyarchaeia archaeon]|nr:peptide deformylase [Candidatus Bathyarchaeia archaeon]